MTFNTGKKTEANGGTGFWQISQQHWLLKSGQQLQHLLEEFVSKWRWCYRNLGNKCQPSEDYKLPCKKYAHLLYIAARVHISASKPVK